MAADKRELAIVGGGLAGALLAILLAQRGWSVDVFERRGDPRVHGGPDKAVHCYAWGHYAQWQAVAIPAYMAMPAAARSTSPWQNAACMRCARPARMMR